MCYNTIELENEWIFVKKIIFLLIINMLFISCVYAHSGRTDANGCHACNTNCEIWGYEYGTTHCHNSSSSAENNDGNSSEVKNISTNTYKKSSDNTIKTITIDETTYDNLENIVYETYNNYVNIDVITSNSKATYKINNSNELQFGENYINIVVTAENGSAKTYNIIIKRLKKLSSEKEIEITINNEKIIFDNYVAKINVSNATTNVSMDYVLKDSNAKVEMNKINELALGDNEIIINVIAEDGTSQEYKIIINRSDTNNDLLYGMCTLLVVGGLSFGIYKKYKQKNSKK